MNHLEKEECFVYMPQQPVRNVRYVPPIPAAATAAGTIPLASAYVPVQVFRNVMDDARGLRKGTIFEELYLPLEEGGLGRGR